MDMAVDEGIEDELRIFSVVTDLSLIGQPFAFLDQAQADGVDLDAVVIEREEMSPPVDARLGRGGEVERHLLEVGARGSQHVGNGIVALALQVKFHRGQQSLDGRLVDDLVANLSHDGVGEDGGLVKQLLVTAHRVKLQDEVATLYTGIGCVGVGLQQNADIARGVGLIGILHIDIVQPSADIMGVFHVGADFQAAVGADGQGIIHQAHLIEVGFREVATDGAIYLVGVEQQVGANASFEDLVMTYDVEFSTTVRKRDGGHQVVQVPTAVLQSLDAGVGGQSAFGREDVGAIASGLDVGGQGADGVFGQEMMQVQLPDVDIGMVGHPVCLKGSIGIEGNSGVTCQLDAAASLLECQVGGIVGTVGC